MVLLVALCLDDHRYALHLPSVERVVRMVEVTPLPDAPAIVAGVVNIGGRITPAINLRRRFGLPERELALSDQLIVARTPRRGVALIVDAVADVIECSEQEISTADAIVPGMRYLEGIAKLKDGMILIHDLDLLLSLEEDRALDAAMEDAALQDAAIQGG